MTLYRTDEFSKERSTDISQVLMYELFDRENEQLFANLLSISLSDIFKEDKWSEYQSLIEAANREAQKKFVDDLVFYWNQLTGRNFKYAVWLYPLDNVKLYIEFYACDEEMLPMIFGYETSDTAIIKYENEGTLYFYEELPEIKEKV